MVDVSIIIVNWNGKKFLRECLQSILDATTQLDCETIVVDNASSDGSQEMVKQEFPSVILIEHGSNDGFARGNNIGIERAQGRYYCLINSDVTVEKACIAAMLAYMEERPEVGMLGPRIIGTDGELQQSWTTFPSLSMYYLRAFGLSAHRASYKEDKRKKMRSLEKREPFGVEALFGVFWMVRRDAVAQVGGLDEAYFMYLEDIDWCRRFGQGGWKIACYPAALATHYGGASSSASAMPEKYLLQFQCSRMIYWKKYYSAPSLWALVGANALHHLIRLPYYVFLRLCAPRRRAHAAVKLKACILSLKWLVGFTLRLGRDEQRVFN